MFEDRGFDYWQAGWIKIAESQSGRDSIKHDCKHARGCKNWYCVTSSMNRTLSSFDMKHSPGSSALFSLIYARAQLVWWWELFITIYILISAAAPTTTLSYYGDISIWKIPTNMWTAVLAQSRWSRTHHCRGSFNLIFRKNCQSTTRRGLDCWTIKTGQSLWLCQQ